MPPASRGQSWKHRQLAVVYTLSCIVGSLASTPTEASCTQLGPTLQASALFIGRPRLADAWLKAVNASGLGNVPVSYTAFISVQWALNPEGCTTSVDMVFEGYTILGAARTETPNATACCNICKDNSGCAVWIYTPSNLTCFLASKATLYSMRSEPGVVVGFIGNTLDPSVALYHVIPGLWCPEELLAAGQLNSMLGNVTNASLPLTFAPVPPNLVTVTGDSNATNKNLNISSYGTIVKSVRACNSIFHIMAGDFTYGDSLSPQVQRTMNNINILAAIAKSAYAVPGMTATAHCHDVALLDITTPQTNGQSVLDTIVQNAIDTMRRVDAQNCTHTEGSDCTALGVPAMAPAVAASPALGGVISETQPDQPALAVSPIFAVASPPVTTVTNEPSTNIAAIVAVVLSVSVAATVVTIGVAICVRRRGGKRLGGGGMSKGGSAGDGDEGPPEPLLPTTSMRLTKSTNITLHGSSQADLLLSLTTQPSDMQGDGSCCGTNMVTALQHYREQLRQVGSAQYGALAAHNAGTSGDLHNSIYSLGVVDTHGAATDRSYSDTAELLRSAPQLQRNQHLYQAQAHNGGGSYATQGHVHGLSSEDVHSLERQGSAPVQYTLQHAGLSHAGGHSPHRNASSVMSSTSSIKTCIDTSDVNLHAMLKAMVVNSCQNGTHGSGGNTVTGSVHGKGPMLERGPGAGPPDQEPLTGRLGQYTLQRTASGRGVGVHAMESAHEQGQRSSGPPAAGQNTDAQMHMFLNQATTPSWVLDHNMLEYERRIGSGSYGTVWLGRWQGAPVAIKTLNLLAEGADEDKQQLLRGLRALEKEMLLLSSMRHPKIVMFIGATLSPLALVMEYCRFGSLYGLLRRARQEDDQLPRFTWLRKVQLVHDAVQGMLYLHNHHCVHGDLKSPNLLVDASWTCKVTDFGLASLTNQESHSTVSVMTNPRWTAPEVLNGGRPSMEADVYSMGIIMYEVVTLQEPFSDLKPVQVISSVLLNHQRPPVPEVPDEVYQQPGAAHFFNLMEQCWHRDPAQRPTMQQLDSTLRMIRQQLRQSFRQSSNASTETSANLSNTHTGTLATSSGLSHGSIGVAAPVTPVLHSQPHPAAVSKQLADGRDAEDNVNVLAAHGREQSIELSTLSSPQLSRGSANSAPDGGKQGLRVGAQVGLVNETQQSVDYAVAVGVGSSDHDRMAARPLRECDSEGDCRCAAGQGGAAEQAVTEGAGDDSGVDPVTPRYPQTSTSRSSDSGGASAVATPSSMLAEVAAQQVVEDSTASLPVPSTSAHGVEGTGTRNGNEMTRSGGSALTSTPQRTAGSAQASLVPRSQSLAPPTITHFARSGSCRAPARTMNVGQVTARRTRMSEDGQRVQVSASADGQTSATARNTLQSAKSAMLPSPFLPIAVPGMEIVGKPTGVVQQGMPPSPFLPTAQSGSFRAAAARSPDDVESALNTSDTVRDLSGSQQVGPQEQRPLQHPVQSLPAPAVCTAQHQHVAAKSQLSVPHCSPAMVPPSPFLASAQSGEVAMKSAFSKVHTLPQVLPPSPFLWSAQSGDVTGDKHSSKVHSRRAAVPPSPFLQSAQSGEVGIGVQLSKAHKSCSAVPPSPFLDCANNGEEAAHSSHSSLRNPNTKVPPSPFLASAQSGDVQLQSQASKRNTHLFNSGPSPVLHSKLDDGVAEVPQGVAKGQESAVERRRTAVSAAELPVLNFVSSGTSGSRPGRQRWQKLHKTVSAPSSSPLLTMTSSGLRPVAEEDL